MQFASAAKLKESKIPFLIFELPPTWIDTHLSPWTDDFLKYIPESVFVNMDLVTARNIIQASTLENRITSEILKDSKCSFFTTMNKYNRLSVKNNNINIILNNNINVIQTDIICTNGIIHIIDSLIIPKIQI